MGRIRRGGRRRRREKVEREKERRKEPDTDTERERARWDPLQRITVHTLTTVY